MEKLIGHSNVTVNDEGYLQNFTQWSKEVAEEIAKELSIQLTPRHWEVLGYLQNEYKQGHPLSIRAIGKSGVVDIKEFYALFPGGPLKLSTKIAGIPKPASCL
jgi:TusE/DsrC/DsvC family sulfur relay protein